MNLTFDLLGEELGSPARRNKKKSYASLRLTTRFSRDHLRTGETSVRNAYGTYHILPVPWSLAPDSGRHAAPT